MSKKQGSAMILAILLLAFFMALSLNMWFISQKKAERSGDKIIGNKILTDIDSSSTLGYYELYLATEYVVNGFVTTPSAYTIPTVSKDYTTESGLTVSYGGIYLSSQQQYFGSYVSSSGSFGTTVNAFVETETISNSKLTGRTWQTVNSSSGGAIISELLWNNYQKSIGGYSLSSLKINGTLITLGTITSESSFMSYFTIGSSAVPVVAVYKKTVALNSSDSNKNKTAVYIITVTREGTYQRTTTSEGAFVEDGITQILVEKQN